MFSISAENLFFTNGDIEVVHNNNRYVLLPFEIDPYQFTPGFSTENVEIDMSNALGWFTSYFLNQNRQGEVVVLSKYYAEGVVADYLKCFIENFVLDGDDARMILSTVFALWKKKTMRYPSALCPWPFKISSECGYLGSETWCDRTGSRCEALGNYPNFGGRKYITELETKRIYWGPEGS